MDCNVEEFEKLKNVYIDILKDSIQKLENLFLEEMSNILKAITVALNKGFTIEDGKLIYKGRIKVKYFTNGERVIELENPYYIDEISVVKVFPLTIYCCGNHPHCSDDGKLCLGDIKSFSDFIKGFPTNLETVYVLSVYRLDEMIKRKLSRLGLM